MDIDLSYALRLKPERAIAYFKAKGFAISWDWFDLWQEAHAKAFTVAKVLKLDILQDIRDSLERALSEGTTFEKFQKAIEPTLRAKGWWGRQFLVDERGGVEKIQLGSPWRLRTIYETNLQTAYSAGHWQSQIENVESRPYWMYNAILDSRTRPAHRALDGLVFPYDHPFWKQFYPPNGWNCRCSVRALTPDQRESKLASHEIWETEGDIGTVEKLISVKTGELADVAEFRFTDAAGRRLAVSTDPGWSYNPGEAAWQPDLQGLDPDIAGLY